MTTHKDFLSKDDPGKVQDIKTLNKELGAVATSLGISAGELTQLDEDTQNAEWIFNFLKSAGNEMEQITGIKDLLFKGPSDSPVSPPIITPPGTPPATLKAGIFKRYRKLVKKIKSSSNYTDEIGKLLGIIGAEIVIDYDTLKPEAKLKRSSFNEIVVDVKKGPAKRIAVYCHVYKSGTPVPTDPGDEIEWDMIAILEHPPFVDHRLNQTNHPETRLYKFVYIINDKVVGIPSDIVRVVAEVYETFSGAELSTKVK